MDAEVPVNYVVQQSGHKNLESLDLYEAASVEHQRKMPFILSCSYEQSTTSTVSHLVRESISVLVILMCHFSGQEFSQAFVSAISKVVLSHLTFIVKKKKAQSAKPKKRKIIISDDSNSDE